MSQVFRIKEVLDFAIKREQESIALYKKIADQLENGKFKNLFEQLAEQEKKHETFYTDMSARVDQERSAGPKDQEAYEQYMLDMINSDRTIQASIDLSDMRAVLDFAIQREQDSVLFYTGLKNLVSTQAHSEIDQIIAEENEHAAVLTSVKKTLV